jgi:alpha-methylacyl-CoA racemase
MNQELIKVDWLKGTKILLIAHYIPGPIAAYLLKCLGAEVIKCEPPFYDLMRQLPPFIKSKNRKMNAYFRALNAGFKSIVVDFTKEGGLEILRDLIKASDVLIDGNRANYLNEVLGEAVSKINEDIVHIPITAYGLKGPMKDIAGHDNNVLSLAGTLSYSSVGARGTPSIFSAQLADITSGYIAALIAVSSILGKRNCNSNVKIGTVDASMMHAAFFLNQIYIAGMNVTGKTPAPGKELLNGGLPNYAMYLTKDEKSIFFGPIEPNLFKNFCKTICREDLINLLNRNNSKLYDELVSLFESKDLKEWEALLHDCDCCFTRVNTLAEAVIHPQIKELGLITEVEDYEYGTLSLTGFPAGFTENSLQPDFTEPAPEPGQHTKEILKEFAGYHPEKIEKLINEKVVYTISRGN